MFQCIFPPLGRGLVLQATDLLACCTWFRVKLECRVNELVWTYRSTGAYKMGKISTLFLECALGLLKTNTSSLTIVAPLAGVITRLLILGRLRCVGRIWIHHGQSCWRKRVYSCRSFRKASRMTDELGDSETGDQAQSKRFHLSRLGGGSKSSCME